MAGVSVPGTLRTLANDAFDMFTHVGIGPQVGWVHVDSRAPVC